MDLHKRSRKDCLLPGGLFLWLNCCRKGSRATGVFFLIPAKYITRQKEGRSMAVQKGGEFNVVQELFILEAMAKGRTRRIVTPQVPVQVWLASPYIVR